MQCAFETVAREIAYRKSPAALSAAVELSVVMDSNVLTEGIARWGIVESLTCDECIGLWNRVFLDSDAWPMVVDDFCDASGIELLCRSVESQNMFAYDAARSALKIAEWRHVFLPPAIAQFAQSE